MFANGLISAMEEIENELPVDQAEAAEAAVAVADESAEIQQDSDEIGTTVAQVEDAVQAGDELESIGEVAVDAVEEGEGLSEESAEMASIAIESIRNRLGFRATTRLVPATESFGNTNTRVMSTKLVIEGIGDTLKKIWAAIKAAALRVWDMIRSFMAKLFNSATLLNKHIQALKDRARGLSGDLSPKEKKIKSSVAKVFSVKGKASLATAKEIIANTDVMVKVCHQVSAMQRDVSRAAEDLAAAGEINAESVKKFMTAQKGGAQKILSAFDLFSKMDPALANMTAKAKKSTKSTVNHAYGPFVGNQVLAISISDVKVLDFDGQSIETSFQGAKEKAATEIEALDKNGINEVLAIASKLCNSLVDFKATQKEYEAIVNSTSKTAEVVMKSAEKILGKTGSNSETREGLGELKAAVNDGIAHLASFGKTAPNLTFSCARGLADYASISMRNLAAK